MNARGRNSDQSRGEKRGVIDSLRSRVAALPRPGFRSVRNAVLGTLLALGGVGAAVVTIRARAVQDIELIRIGAISSLVFVVLMSVFVVPPLVRSARREVAQLDLPFQVTPGGFIFVGIFFIVTFAAWNTGNNLLFLIFAVLLSTFFVGWSAARNTLRDMVVSARFPDHIFAGEPAPVLVTLQNRKRLLPSFSILVETRGLMTRTGAKENRKSVPEVAVKGTLAYFMYVPHRAQAQQRVEQTFPRRGRVRITGFELSTRFPFNFFRLRHRLRARNVELIIYPKPEPASDDLHLLPMNAGRLASARRGAGGHDLHSLRDYQPQDDMRHIDWKASARVERLIVREFTAEDERRVHIAFDTRVPPRTSEKEFAARFERGVTLAASLVAHFIDERAEVRLTLGDEQSRYGTGSEQLYESLRRLALVAPSLKPADHGTGEAAFWQQLAPAAHVLDNNYVILLTAAAPGSIPSHLWRQSHVIYL